MKWKLLIPLILLSSTGLATSANAHGVTVQHQIAMTQTIEINAAYDSGEPMANAQITVYAPDDPATPWLQGMADERGRFLFVPDRSQVGSWDVKVRKAGHGDIISIPLVEEKPISETVEPSSQLTTVTSKASSSYSTLQKWLMAASTIWGFVGTALFFSRNKTHAHS